MKPPGKLYKYRPLDAKTIQTIVSSVIYFAEPCSFNDPFDCRLRPSNVDGTDDEYRQFFTRNLVKRGLPAEKVTCEVERMIREGIHRNEQLLDKCWDETQKEENKKTGLCCLTEDPANILMWSHYADSHRGCCLQFSAANSIFMSARIVEYPPIYPTHRFLDCVNDHELLYKLTLFTKAILWAYEKDGV